MIFTRDIWNELLNGLKGNQELCQYAEQAFESEVLTVTRKRHTLPNGGTLNDYVSIGPYWWPNPNTSDGLPWIRKDGETNPVFYEYDYETLHDFLTVSDSLLLAGLANERADWLERAAAQIEGWFLTPSTKMNPNMKFAQFVPGVAEGRCYGIIDISPMPRLFDLLELLPFSSFWTQKKFDAVRAWAGDMVHWLLTHKQGIEEGNTRNNHAIAYDLIVASMSLFAGDKETAIKQLRDRSIPRIGEQFAVRGSLPLELERTNSKGYSTFCLTSFFQAGYMARRLGIDFPKETLLKGLEWLDANIDSPNWKWLQIVPFETSSMAPLYYIAGLFLDRQDLIDKGKALAEKPWSHLISWRIKQ